LERTIPLHQHVEDVLAQLDVNRSGFQQLSREFNGTMELVGYFAECDLRLFLAAKTVHRIAEYELTLDCDFDSVRSSGNKTQPAARHIGGIIGPY
jgi:hypothetical protein